MQLRRSREAWAPHPHLGDTSALEGRRPRAHPKRVRRRIRQNMRDILWSLAETLRFGTFISILLRTELTHDLRYAGPFVVLAPTDAAFESLPPGVFASYFRRESAETLVDFVEAHVFRRRAGRPCATGEEWVCSNGVVRVHHHVSLPTSFAGVGDPRRAWARTSRLFLA